MKPFLTLCLIALHGCAQAAAQPLRTWERLDLPIEEGLRLALDQQLPHRDALDYILWAGYRGSPSDRTLLRQIVEGYEEERLPQSYARVALSSLEFLGEDEDYFVSLARHWDEAEDAEARERRKWVAYYAGMSIARRPTPEVLAAFEEINARTSDGYLNGAFGMPRFIAHYMEQYRSLPSVGEKVERTAAWTWPDKVQMAVDWTRFGWTSGGGLHGFRENLNPKAVVGQRWLAELSRQYPGEVAEAIAAVEFSEAGNLLFNIDDLRAYVASFTSDEVRALLAGLTEEP
ncbi:MAG TPA: hypothetical protein VK002_02215 [Rubricoccaceae bacterium]|nr:hypothetical protein [Rubricoccaceae bacterium]